MKDHDDDPKTDQFEVDLDLLDASEKPSPDALDFLRTVEMEKVGPMTQPMAAMDAVTRPRVTPPEILRMARSTAESEAVDAIEFRASMDPDGAITVPEALRARIHGPIRVCIYLDKK